MRARRVVLVAGTTALVALLLAGGYLFMQLKNGDPRILQTCAEEAAAPMGWACERALFRYHPTPAEVQRFNAEGGPMYAVTTNNEAFARRLLAHYLAAGIDINATVQRLPMKWTALHAMVVQGNPMAVRLLVEHGADTAMRDADGKAPLDLARELHAKEPSDARAQVLQVLMAEKPRQPVEESRASDAAKP
ncbi:hypothetical protein M8A51_08510 [Schlegelella sp. S2-27]|uniref:Ankyrin repeat domain-containing protein n=1 Tax=Caldimonas mangrovi TaxID=2944811 RepID=A0ABT0YLP1_9BURK|nr:ankyrin repeat domain-containing protein [Caldimonas mangrovi]MCM5679573.1 hypothetical protein [Caldimonas mangrovi]